LSASVDISPLALGSENGERETRVRDAKHWRSRRARSARPVCRACPASWGCKSPVQPDGGEALAKRKGGTARDRLKEARSKVATRRTDIGYEAVLVGRAGRRPQSPYPSRARTVNPAGAR